MALHTSPPFTIWQKPWGWCLIVLAMTAPYWVTALPPMMDLPGHMARYHLMRALPGDADLQRYYAYDWRLAGNLGVDLIVYALRDWFTVQQATWGASLFSVLMMTAALPLLSKVFHGSVQVSAYAALPLVYAHYYFWGFLNFNLSIAAALLALALWQAMAHMPVRRAALFVPLACLVWLCHTIGWAVLALCIGVVELQRIYAQGALWQPRAAAMAVLRGACVGIPLVLIIYWRTTNGGSASGYGSSAVTDKLLGLVQFLRSYNATVDMAGAFAVLLVLALLGYRALRGRPVPVAQPLLICGLALAAIYAVMPGTIFGSFYADVRLVHVFMILLLLSLATPKPANWHAGLAAGLLLFAAVRLALITQGWQQSAGRTNSHLAALDKVPVGSRIVALNVAACTPADWAIQYEYNHLADMAIVRRNAFTNSQWYVPGAQPSRPIYNQDTPFGADPSQYVWDGPCTPTGLHNFQQALAAIPRAQFDYLWLIRRDLAVSPLPPGLKLIYADRQTALYALR